MRIVLLLITSLIMSSCYSAKNTSDSIDIELGVIRDKIHGAWAAKTIGCSYGGPLEFTNNGTMVQDYVPVIWDDSRVEHYYKTFPGLYDDIYVEINFIQTIERVGIDAPVDSFAVSFANADFPLWHANQAARYNINHGIMPPMSGHWINNPHADDIDFQIESDFAGLMCPGLPNAATEICDRVGHMICYGDGWYGGVFTAALYSIAFTTDDVETIVRNALMTIPSQCDFYRCIDSVIDCWKKNPDDWKDAWYLCQKNWSEERGCPDGVFKPFDIDAKINSAYVVIGLLFGNKDFFNTMDIAARCGQDSDCNAATAAGILGTILGYEGIPDYWKRSLSSVSAIPFNYTDISLDSLSNLSYSLATKNIERLGCSIEGSMVRIPVQKPIPVRFEESFPDHKPMNLLSDYSVLSDESFLRFSGNGFVQKGYVKSSDPDYVAFVEQTIDGSYSEIISLPAFGDNSVDNRRVDISHKYQLSNGDHVVKFCWLNPAENAQVVLTEAVVYSKQ